MAPAGDPPGAPAWSPARIKECLFPLTRLESFLEPIVESLPRRRIAVEFVPVENIEAVSPETGEFRATFGPPKFLLQSRVPLRGGWYYLEVALVRNNGNRIASVEASTPASKVTFEVPTNLRGTVREVIELPDGTASVHWIPSSGPGYFTQTPLLLHEISTLESALRRAYRAADDLWRLRNTRSAARVGLTWTGILRDLRDAYQRTARLRIDRLLGNDYPGFLAVHDRPSEAQTRALRRAAAAMTDAPLVSLLMPLRNGVPALFEASLRSLSDQVYSRWELIVVAAPECPAGVRELARSWVARDRRIRVLDFPDHAVGAETINLLNAAIGESRGEFVARLDAHDRLHPRALFLMVEESVRNPGAGLLYSDEDAIDAEEVRQDPRFKPDWNPDLLASHHYIGSLAVYRRDLVARPGGYAAGFEGAEDYELALRCSRAPGEGRIMHVQQALYHRHRTRAATPVQEAAAHEAGTRALQAHIGGTGVTIEDGASPGEYHAIYPLPVPPALVSIIIATRDKPALLRNCVEGILHRTDYARWELLVVDNDSTDSEALAYLDTLRLDPRVRVLRHAGAFNYSAINNEAARHATGEVLVLLNNDIEVISPGWLTEMVRHALRPEIGAVGAKLLYPNGMVQHAGVVTGIGGVAGHVHRFLKDEDPGYCHRAALVQNLSAVTAACLAVRARLFAESGGLDEVHLPVAFNDIDLCLRLCEAGYRNLYTPYAKLYHHESMSRGRDDTPEKHARYRSEFDYMRKRWGDRLQRDSAYNSNLTLDLENFSLKT